MDIISIFSNEFCGTLIRFFICMVVNWGIIHFLYYRKSHRNDFYFTFMLMTVAIFFLVYFMMGMDRGKATMGVGLGLFGIFSIMRYRTDTMPVREMTYLFLIVCLSVVHSMAESFGELLIVDVLTIIAIIICEMRFKIHATKLIQYDRVELIKPEKREELIADLEARTGLKIIKIEVGGVDFLKDSVVLRVTYDSDQTSDVDNQFRVRKSQWREA
ncbi:DUF4956 domain-containing protein [Prevotella sp. E13-27]|jgi:hypothetical protein|uniref:DUF4956 domain-containing protein n=1 Tax=Prevotella sp. E13-27 TaxID=2938122 RepID=UPI002009F1F1|nr:DUF4956 domain-containing protein [Prevotella sp. E13-27]MCK8623528.1 DUF4956 domain-containing protein [Prevotella sp. E13-27]